MLKWKRLIFVAKIAVWTVAIPTLMPWLVHFPLAGGFNVFNYESLRFSDNVFLDLRILTGLALLSPFVTAIACRRFRATTPLAIFASLWPFAVAVALYLSPMSLKEGLFNPFKIFLMLGDPLIAGTEVAPNFSFEKFNELPNTATESQVIAQLGKSPYSIYYDRIWRYSRALSGDGDYWEIMVVMKEDGLEKKIKFYHD